MSDFKSLKIFIALCENAARKRIMIQSSIQLSISLFPDSSILSINMNRKEKVPEVILRGNLSPNFFELEKSGMKLNRTISVKIVTFAGENLTAETNAEQKFIS